MLMINIDMMNNSKMKKIYIALLLFSGINSFAQQRFRDEVFGLVDSIVNVQYGENRNTVGRKEKLFLDVMMPSSDTCKKRPLLLYFDGGGFSHNSYGEMLCRSFTQRGYVTAAVEYRMDITQSGMNGLRGKDRTNADYTNALYRAQQDGRAAIRFFRKNAEQYGVDTNQIFISGNSFGASVCLAIAYLNEDEVPHEVDRKKWGSLDGESGNAGHSSKVNGVINAWGAMIDYRWIGYGDVPLFNTAGTEDKIVPFDSAFDDHGLKYGPYFLFQHCLSLGIPTGWRPFNGAGHALDNNTQKQDSCIQSIAHWLYTQLSVKNPAKDNSVFRYDNDINRFDSINNSVNYSDTAIIFMGSSYIRLWKNIREDLGYQAIIHRGFGGATLRDVAFYVKRIVYPVKPKAIFMYVGNDIVGGARDKDPDQVLEHFKYVVKQIREKYPDMPITWLAISPSEKRWSVWKQVQQANQLIKDYCSTQSKLYFINAGSGFLNADGLPESKYYRDDRLHYNEEGYRLWGKLIGDQVKAILQKK